MKTANDFWEVIGRYNIETIYYQVIFSFLLLGVLLASFIKQNSFLTITAKSLFSAVCSFVGIYFFLIVDKSITAKIFGPYFILIGILFLYDLLITKEQLQKPTRFQFLLYGLALLYPLISYILNHRYPQQVLYILPCPIISIALITYCRLKKRNDILNIMLIIWGLTGVKAFIFDVKEDLILLVIGIYGLYDFIKYKQNKGK